MNEQNFNYGPSQTNGDVPPTVAPQQAYPQQPYPQQAYPQQPYPQRPQGRQLSAGTFLFPLAFMAIHMLVQVIVMVVVGLVVGMSVLPGFNGDGNQLMNDLVNKMGDITIYSLLISAPVQIAIYILAGWLLKERSKPYIYYKAPRVGDTLRAAIIALGFIGIANLIMLMFQELAKASTFVETQYETYLKSSETFNMNGNILLSTLTLVLLVPIAEELLFRGLISGEFRRAMPDWLNILITGLLFSIFHMNFIQSIYVLPAGLVLSAVGVWSRSIWVPIVLHAVYNFCGSTLLMIMGENEALATVYFFVQLACIVMSVGLLICSYKVRKPATSATA